MHSNRVQRPGGAHPGAGDLQMLELARLQSSSPPQCRTCELCVNNMREENCTIIESETIYSKD